MSGEIIGEGPIAKDSLEWNSPGCYAARQTHGRVHDTSCDGLCRIRALSARLSTNLMPKLSKNLPGTVGHPPPAKWHGGTRANAITLLDQAMACAISDAARLEIGKIRDLLRREAV